MSEEQDLKNSKLAKKLVLIAVLMFGFGYALVPLYDVLCDITGQNTVIKESGLAKPDKTDLVENGTTGGTIEYVVDESREISVEFITSVNERTPLVFHSETRILKVHPGQFYTVNFYAKNISGALLKAQAIPSITPGLAEEFFKKTQCFCFTKQTFEIGEEKTMPVRFVVDTKLPEGYKTITLSYTFFDITNKSED